MSPNELDRLQYVSEIPIKTILKFLVKEGVAAEMDKAKMVVDYFLGGVLMCEGMISINEFKKLFQKGIFKQALMRIS